MIHVLSGDVTDDTMLDALTAQLAGKGLSNRVLVTRERDAIKFSGGVPRYKLKDQGTEGKIQVSTSVEISEPSIFCYFAPSDFPDVEENLAKVVGPTGMLAIRQLLESSTLSTERKVDETGEVVGTQAIFALVEYPADELAQLQQRWMQIANNVYFANEASSRRMTLARDVKRANFAVRKAEEHLADAVAALETVPQVKIFENIGTRGPTATQNHGIDAIG